MGARHKLNVAYFYGSLMLAILAGALTQSWLAFFVALAVSLGLNVYLNEIRPAGEHRRRGKR